MLPEPDLFQCGSPTCNTLSRRRRELEEQDRSPGHTVLGPDSQVTLGRSSGVLVGSLGRPNEVLQGGLHRSQGGGKGKSLAVYSSLLGAPGTVVGEPEPGLQGSGRRWYLLVIVLLYIGLITSFCLNVTLLVRREPERVVRLEGLARTGPGTNGGSLPVEVTTAREREFAYTTACLVEDPCVAGSYYSCPSRQCLPCPPSSYQPQWGQTSCWPCPPNTTTDTSGRSSATECKASHCVHRSRPGLAIVESPNYPGAYPLLASCHWRVEPGQGGSLLLLLPYLSLPPGCSHTLTIRNSEDRQVFSSCQPVTQPTLLTAEGGVLWVDFSPSPPDHHLPSLHPDPVNSTAGGFQLSLLSVPGDLLPLIQAVTGQVEQDTHLDRIKQQIWGYNQKEQRLMSHLLSLLAPGQRGPGQRGPPTDPQGEKPLIEVVEDL